MFAGRASLAAFAWLTSGCSGDRTPGEVRNVLLITLDTTRADVLSGDGESRALAPAIAALADGGVRFPRAYTVAPLTLPAHASILTGLYPPRHGVRDNGLAALPGSARTLAEILEERGFATAAFVSSAVLDRAFRLDQGFELYDQPALGPRTGEDFYLERPARETAGLAARWFSDLAERAQDQSRPFFLWVHFFEPHIPYEPGPEFLARAGGDTYRGEVATVDAAVGELVAALERAELARSTLIVLTSDHGESLGEHGEPTHGALCYEAAVRVPLVLRFPGPPPAPGPVRLASTVDLAPTILGRLGIALPPDLDGVDLFAPADVSAARRRGVYLESYSGYLNYGWSPLAGWVDARGKYLHSSRPEFYQCQGDPEERTDLARERARECEEVRREMSALFARPPLEPDPEPEDVVDGALARALAALGYAAPGERAARLPAPLEASDRPSPGERALELRPLLLANALYEAGRYDECLPLVEGIVRENGGHLLALDLLGLCLMQQGRFDEAEGFLRQRLSLAERADARLNLGLCLLELGRPAEALVELRAAEQLDPGQPAIREALTRARQGSGEER